MYKNVHNKHDVCAVFYNSSNGCVQRAGLAFHYKVIGTKMHHTAQKVLVYLFYFSSTLRRIKSPTNQCFFMSQLGGFLLFSTIILIF